MANNALYFPYIDLPRNQFTNTALLYWDQIITIAPYNTEYELTAKNQNDVLIREKAIRQVHPERYSHRYPNFGLRFTELIDSLNLDRMYRKTGGWAATPDAAATASRIHTGKVLTQDLYLKLIDRNLLIEQRGPWLLVEPITADLFMHFLSQCLAQEGELDCFPVTDERFNLRRLATTRTAAPRQDNRECILDRLLPISLERLNAEQILELRSKHQVTRKNFRESIEFFVNEELVHVKDEALRNQLVQDFIIRKNEQIREIQHQLAEFSKSTSNRVGFAALGFVTAAIAAVDLLHGGILSHAATLLGGSAFGATMMYAARNAVKDYREGAPDLQRDMAFAALLRNAER